jgi:general secretion pathway protein I
MRTEAGITLLELVIAVFVLAIGTIAALRSIDHAQRNIGGEAARLFAAQVALNRAEELRLMGARAGRGLPQSVEYGPYSWQVLVEEKETRAGFVEATITARTTGQPGARYVVIVARGDSP